MKSRKKTKLITVHFDEGEFKAFFSLYEKSTAASFSAYARLVLLKKPVVLRYHNDSIDDFLESMIDMKKDLKSIVNSLGLPKETGDPPGTSKPENEELSRRLLSSIDLLLSKITALYQLWLQSPGLVPVSPEHFSITKGKCE